MLPLNRATLYNVASVGPFRYKKSNYLCLTVWPLGATWYIVAPMEPHCYRKFYHPWIIGLFQFWGNIVPRLQLLGYMKEEDKSLGRTLPVFHLVYKG